MSVNDFIYHARNIPTKEKIIIISSVLLLLLLPFVVFVSTSSQKQETRSQAADLTIDSLNSQILENNRTGNFAINKFLLEQRKELMVSLSYSNPSEFLNKVISPEIRNTFPEDQRSLIEEKISLNGSLIPSHLDNFSAGTKKIFHLLQTGDDLLGLNIVPEPNEESLEKVSSVSLSGYKISHQIVTRTSDMNISQSTNALSATGVKKILVFPVNFSDDRSTPYSKGVLEDIFFGDDWSLKKYYKELSDVDLIFSGNVMPMTQLGMNAEKFCTKEGILAAYDVVADKATLLGIPYDSIFMVSKDDKCNFAGWGTIGAARPLAMANTVNLRVIAHEIGHNLGIDHASLLQCTPYGCDIKEYGDKSDAMGQDLAGMNSSHMRSLGFQPNSKIKDFSGDKIYTIYKQESDSSPNTIRYDIPYDNLDIYVEYRGEKGGYDTDVPYALGAGSLIYLWNGNPSSRTKLIDITPLDSDPDNLVMKDGKSIKRSGITIKQISHTDNYARVWIYKGY